MPTVKANSQWKPVVQTFDGMKMALVPPGCFVMGTLDVDSAALEPQLTKVMAAVENEQPSSTVCFKEPFWMDATLVTQAQFKHSGGQSARTPSVLSSDNICVNQITWFEARDFYAKRGARLPTEAEWEYAARGPSDLIYPWGNDFHGSRQTAWAGVDVGPGPSEWTSTSYRAYPYQADDGREGQQDTTSPRVLRGVGWTSLIPYAEVPIEDYFRVASRGAYRLPEVPSASDDLVSFRCARSNVLILAF